MVTLLSTKIKEKISKKFCKYSIKTSSVGREEERSRERDEYLSTQPNVRTKPLQLNVHYTFELI